MTMLRSGQPADDRDDELELVDDDDPEIDLLDDLDGLGGGLSAPSRHLATFERHQAAKTIQYGTYKKYQEALRAPQRHQPQAGRGKGPVEGAGAAGAAPAVPATFVAS